MRFTTEIEKLYFEELGKVAKEKGLRIAVIISALMEGQVFNLALHFKRKRKEEFNPKSANAFESSRKVIKKNKLLDEGLQEDIQHFRDIRKIIVHDAFKGTMARRDLELKIEEAIKIGRPIVNKLHLELFKEASWDTLKDIKFEKSQRLRLE